MLRSRRQLPQVSTVYFRINMKRFFLFLIAIALGAQTPLTTVGVGPGNLTTAAPYVGPGDVVSGAVAWWGLRAYSAAKAGTKAANICHVVPSTVCADINTLANGNFDVAATVGGTLNCGVVTCHVNKLYDQSGSNSCSGGPCDITASNFHPTLAFNVLGSLPAMQSAADTDTFNSASITQAQPFTISFVYESTSTADSGIVSGSIQIRPNQSGAGTGTLYAGNTSFTATMSNNAFHAGQVVFNGASSSINLDGTTSTGSPGTNGYSATPVVVFSISGSIPLTGYITEVGMWSGALTGTQMTDLNSNQHTYWGF